MRIARIAVARCENCGWEWRGRENFFGNGDGHLRSALGRLHFEEQPGPANGPGCQPSRITIKFKPLKKRQQLILKALRDLGGFGTTQDVAKKTGLSANGVSQSLSALRDGYIANRRYVGRGITQWRMASSAFSNQ